MNCIFLINKFGETKSKISNSVEAKMSHLSLLIAVLNSVFKKHPFMHSYGI